MFRFLRRYWVALAVVVLAGVAWPVAFYYLTSFRNPDVPLVATPAEVVDAMIELGGIRPEDVVFDLGCGDGRLVIAAAGQRGARGIGIEIDPELARKAREEVAAAGLGDRVEIRRNDMFREDFRPASVVLMFLMPSVNERLLPQFERMKPGTRIVSHQYCIPGIKATKRLEIPCGDRGFTRPIYLYVNPLEKE
jgi:tRNA A58 N-methylase Trm61